MARFHVDCIVDLGSRTGGSKESLTGPTDNTDSNYRRTWGGGTFEYLCLQNINSVYI